MFAGWEFENKERKGQESLAGKWEIQGVWVDFVPRLAGMCYFSDVPPAPFPLERVNFALRQHPISYRL